MRIRRGDRFSDIPELIALSSPSRSGWGRPGPASCPGVPGCRAEASEAPAAEYEKDVTRAA